MCVCTLLQDSDTNNYIKHYFVKQDPWKPISRDAIHWYPPYV